eukprot:278573_1
MINADYCKEKGEFNISSRLRLTGCVKKKDRDPSDKIPCFQALNEVLLDRGQSRSFSTIEVKVNNVLLSQYATDGVLLTTPTGSTGYSMSLDGPIIFPSSSALLVMPFATHAIGSPPVVLPSESKVTFTILKTGWKPNDVIQVGFDSDNFQDVKKGDTIEMFRSDSDLRLVIPGTKAFDFSKDISEKLLFNRRVAE